MSARDLLRQADALRSQAEVAEQAVKLLRPGVGLGLAIGTYRLDRPEIVAVVTAALTDAAQTWNAEADAIDARVVVNP